MSFKVVEKENIVQKWVVVSANDINDLYDKLNQVSQALLKQNPTFSPKSHSICYNSDMCQYVMTISYEGSLDYQNTEVEKQK